MKPALFTNTRTLTKKLVIFFTLVALIMGLAGYFIFFVTLKWSEDKVGERRIDIDKNEAIYRFTHGESGKIQIDVLTDAYNDIQLVPKEFHKYFEGKSHFVGEVADSRKGEDDSKMLYFGYYRHHASDQPVILLSDINQIEFGQREVVLSSLIVITIIALLLAVFGAFLLRLSHRLIAPLNDLTTQLQNQQGNTAYVFNVLSGSAKEFQTLADQLNQDRHEIQGLLKREQAFARYASHELRTPLTITKGACQLLSRRALDEFQQSQLTRINDATEQMITMTDALLGLVRYERSEEDTQLRAINQEEFARIIERNQAHAHNKAIEIELHYHDEPQLKATPAVLNMVVGNLLRNAIAATQQGTITLTVNAKYLTIQDSGEGLNHHDYQHGHGLGLLIVDDICHRYHWRFSLTNRSEKGCEARIEFQP